MGRYTTKEDDVDRISTSVYVTNFPDNVSAKELFLACKQYGHVVDSYIPVKNQRTEIDSMANIADSMTNGNEKSYRGVLNGDTKTKLVGKISEPSIVLGDECVMSMNVDNALFGRVKVFASLANLKMALGNEGFSDIVIKYMGEQWVMQEIGPIKKSIREDFKITHRGKMYWIRANETQGWVSEFTDEYESEDDNSMDEEGEVKKNGIKDEHSDGELRVAMGLFKGSLQVSEIPRTGGSMVGLLEDVIKVGQVMGFKMEGVIANLEELIGTQGGKEDFLMEQRILWRGEVSNDEIKDVCEAVRILGRLASLYVYKIIAKILTNRLVDVLGGIINEVQSAFIKDRQILDGPFILNEVMSWCKKKKKQTLLFKVDFEKAYDSVRWDFLDDVLGKFGFGDKWRKWIQCCLHSSKGSIIINGSPTDEFQFGRGLKQGDPLSPFLFLLIMESLHISFQRVVDAGMFHGIDVGGLVNLSHMFYADDAVFIEVGGLRKRVLPAFVMKIETWEWAFRLYSGDVWCDGGASLRNRFRRATSEEEGWNSLKLKELAKVINPCGAISLMIHGLGH
ncbi:RNA-directed DNA polymerase, eukaryota, reverse transcriptase zinc-binding domain protein [Tanacetum coccineum]